MQNTLGNIGYEITNYPPKVGRSLGNVNVVVSDRKIWNTTANAFKAVTRNYTDYFPCVILAFINVEYDWLVILQTIRV